MSRVVGRTGIHGFIIRILHLKLAVAQPALRSQEESLRGFLHKTYLKRDRPVHHCYLASVPKQESTVISVLAQQARFEILHGRRCRNEGLNFRRAFRASLVLPRVLHIGGRHYDAVFSAALLAAAAPVIH